MYKHTFLDQLNEQEKKRKWFIRRRSHSLSLSLLSRMEDPTPTHILFSYPVRAFHSQGKSSLAFKSISIMREWERESIELMMQMMMIKMIMMVPAMWCGRLLLPTHHQRRRRMRKDLLPCSRAGERERESRTTRRWPDTHHVIPHASSVVHILLLSLNSPSSSPPDLANTGLGSLSAEYCEKTLG